MSVAVVFDTNAYRDVCVGVAGPSGHWTQTTLRQREEVKGITAYANPFVVMELASHLHDATDPDYAECRQALGALFHHCQVGTEPSFRLVAPSEGLIAQFLYGKAIPYHDDTTEKIAKLTYFVASAAPGPLDLRIAAACKELADYIDGREAAFVSDMQGFVQKLNPAAVDWHPLKSDKAGRQKYLAEVRSPLMRWHIALGLAMKARAMIGKPVQDPGLKEDADKVLEAGGASIALYQAILERIVSTGCDVSKRARANWLWDMQIAFAIGQDFGTPPAPLLLVTSDGAVLDAAKTASVQVHVKSLTDYLAAL